MRGGELQGQTKRAIIVGARLPEGTPQEGGETGKRAEKKKGAKKGHTIQRKTKKQQERGPPGFYEGGG